ncbi:hypothetical protein ACFVHQ_06930 [Actinomycetes bacterium NPDC127524]
MSYGEWYQKRNPIYTKWKHRWSSRANMENGLLYAIPSAIMIALPFMVYFF